MSFSERLQLEFDMRLCEWEIMRVKKVLRWCCKHVDNLYLQFAYNEGIEYEKCRRWVVMSRILSFPLRFYVLIPSLGCSGIYRFIIHLTLNSELFLSKTIKNVKKIDIFIFLPLTLSHNIKNTSPENFPLTINVTTCTLLYLFIS